MLKYIPHPQFYSGTPAMMFEYEGFSIPALEKNPDIGIFNMKSFQTLVTNRTVGVVCDVINMFLSTWKDDIEAQKEYVSCFVLVNTLLKQQTEIAADVHDIVDECQRQITKLDTTIGLCERIHAWAEKAFDTGVLPMADMSAAGSRPQDREDMTFFQNDARRLTEIAILSKLMTPITGEFIYRHTSMINSRLKESFAVQIFTGCLGRYYRDIMEKLTYYANKLITPKESLGIAAYANGYTPEIMGRTILDGVLCKKYGTINLFQEGGNIVTFTATCIKSARDSQLKNNANNYNLKTFADPKDGDESVAGNEETNSSRIEIESTSSNKPAIISPLAKISASWLVQKLCEDEKVKTAFDEIHGWYLENPSIISPIGEMIIGNCFGAQLGGGKSIYLIDAPRMMQLASILQFIMTEEGYTVLPHALTTTVSREERQGTMADFTFTNSWKVSGNYTECRKLIHQGFGEVVWDSALKHVVRFMVTKDLIYHTAPYIWAKLPEGIEGEKKNGTIFSQQEQLMNELLICVKQIWKLGSHRESLS